jgi:hypothetical protein
MLTAKRLRELLHYDRHLGWFMWATGAKAGAAAGNLNASLGYVCIGIDGRDYYAHRLAYLFIEGCFPSAEIDHVDRNKSNNAWANLRPASRKQNSENASLQANNSSGARGIYRVPSGRWVAKIKHHQRSLHLGTFDVKRAAVEARRTAERELFTHL